MKRVFLIVLLMVLLFASQAFAAPFLKCDPQAGVEYYSVVENGSTTTVTAEADGAIKMDLSGVAVGSHSITVAACNVWGCSEYVPFSYTKSVVTTPASLKIGK